MPTSADPLIPKRDGPSSAPPNDGTTNNSNIIKKRSLLPRMVAIVIGFTFGLLLYSYLKQVLTLHQALTLATAPLLQAAWATVVVHLGQRGLFSTPMFLQSMPIFWFPMIVVGLTMAVLGPNMALMMQVIDHTPIQVFVALQGLRSLAIGSLIKWYHGVFPTGFALFTALPDFVFGLSALLLLMVGRNQEWIHNKTFVFWWNVVGFTIILPVGVTVLQLGMKPTQLYQQTKSASNSLVFEYPMVLAPGIVVPVLISWNVFLALWASGAVSV